MAIAIRLQRNGRTKKPVYRIIATNKQSKRDGRYLEILGTFNPMIEPPAVSLKEERVKYWVGEGAEVAGATRQLIIKNIPGLIEKREENKLSKIRAARKKRKERLAKTAKKK